MQNGMTLTEGDLTELHVCLIFDTSVPPLGLSHEDTPYNNRSIMNKIIQCSIFLSLQNMGTTKIPIHEDWLCKL